MQGRAASPSPPGPRGSALTGNVASYERNRLGFLLECARTYGDVVAFSRDVTIVNSPFLIEEVITRTYTDFAPPINLLREKVGNASLAEWRRQRQDAVAGLGRSAVRAFAPAIVDETRKVISSWGPTRRVGLSDLEKITSRSIALFCFGSEGKTLPGRSQQLLDALFPIVTSPFVFPSWVPTRANLRLRVARRRLESAIHSLVAARSPAEKQSGDLVSALLAEGAPRDAGLTYLVMSILLAAHGVPAAGVVWTLYLLANAPEEQGRLQEELDSVVGQRDVSSDDLGSLPLLEAAVKESLRLYPPTWLAARRVVRPTQLGAYSFGPGHTIMYSSFVVHRDKQFFDQPTSFVPSRWLDRVWIEALPKYAYFPFGGGPRVCLGATFAMTELKLITATVLQRFTLRLDGGPITIDARRTLVPKGGVVSARPRARDHPANALVSRPHVVQES
jgi:cytochrome P450